MGFSSERRIQKAINRAEKKDNFALPARLTTLELNERDRFFQELLGHLGKRGIVGYVYSHTYDVSPLNPETPPALVGRPRLHVTHRGDEPTYAEHPIKPLRSPDYEILYPPRED